MSDFTPTTDRVRDRYVAHSQFTSSAIGGTEEYRAAFDRWLNEQLAIAWDQGKAAEKRDWEFTWDLVTPDEDREPWTNPYRTEE